MAGAAALRQANKPALAGGVAATRALQPPACRAAARMPPPASRCAPALRKPALARGCHLRNRHVPLYWGIETRVETKGEDP